MDRLKLAGAIIVCLLALYGFACAVASQARLGVSFVVELQQPQPAADDGVDLLR